MKFFFHLWKYKLQIILFSLTIGAIAFFISLALPNQYKSEIVYPNQILNANQGGNINQFSSIARLAGIDVSSSGSRVDMALEMMKSLSFLKHSQKTIKFFQL